MNWETILKICGERHLAKSEGIVKQLTSVKKPIFLPVLNLVSVT